MVWRATRADTIRRVYTLGVVALVSAWSPARLDAATTDEQAAEKMFQQGLADMLAGRYAAACPAIAQSLRLDKQPGTLFTLAVTQEQAERILFAAKNGELAFGLLNEDSKVAPGNGVSAANLFR